MTRRLDYSAIAADGMKALGRVHGYVGQSGLPKTLIDLVYLRASQINGCAYCIDVHTRDLLAQGVSIEKLMLVSVWREAEALFFEQERAALAWTEALTRVAEIGPPSDAEYEHAAERFSEKELVDVTIAVALMNAYNRLAIGFQREPAAVKNL